MASTFELLALAQINYLQNNTPQLISNTTLVANQASVTFSSIPSTYRFLKIYGYFRSTVGATVDVLLLRFNGDTSTSHYPVQFAQAKGASWTLGTFGTNAGIQVGNTPGATATAGFYALTDTTIANWSSATNSASVLTLANEPQAAATQEASIYGGVYTQAVTLTSVTLIYTTGSVAAGSTISLYGVM